MEDQNLPLRQQSQTMTEISHQTESPYLAQFRHKILLSVISSVLTKIYQNKIAIFFFWSVIGFILLLILNSIVLLYISMKFTPRASFIPIDLYLLLSAVLIFHTEFFNYGIWLFLIELIPASIIYWISRYRLLSKTIFFFILITTILICIIPNFILSSEEGSGWLYGGFILIITTLLGLATGILPVLYISGFRKAEFNQKSFWQTGFAVLVFVIFCFWIANINMIRAANKQILEAREELTKVMNRSQFKEYQPTYLPISAGRLANEYAHETETGITYNREYQVQMFSTFSIREEILNEYMSKENYAKSDFTLFNTNTAPNEKVLYLTINGNPAIDKVSTGENNKEHHKVYYYPDNNVRLEIEGLSKEEAIKVIQSLKLVIN